MIKSHALSRFTNKKLYNPALPLSYTHTYVYTLNPLWFSSPAPLGQECVPTCCLLILYKRCQVVTLDRRHCSNTANLNTVRQYCLCSTSWLSDIDTLIIVYTLSGTAPLESTFIDYVPLTAILCAVELEEINSRLNLCLRSTHWHLPRLKQNTDSAGFCT